MATNNRQLINEVYDKLNKLLNNLEALKKVDATVSDTTLKVLSDNITRADECLMRGFIEDSCKEIEEKFKLN